MTIQTIPGRLWIPNSVPAGGTTPAFTSSFTMNTAATWIAFIVQAPKTGTLDQFELLQAVNTNTPDNGIRLSFMDVTSAGAPDNVEDQFAIVTAGFGAGAWLVPSGYMGSTGSGSGTKRSVTKGDWIACVVAIESFVAADSVAMGNLNTGAVSLPINCIGTRYTTTTSNSGTAWAKLVTSTPILALKYDDGTYGVLESPIYPASAYNARTFNSGSAADERGLLFQVPFPASLAGCQIRIDSDNAFDIVLYNAADSVVDTITVTPGIFGSTSALNGVYSFASSITLTPNANYRLVVKPGASNVSIYDFDCNSQAIREAVEGGPTWMSTNRVDAGAWTDVNTNRPFISLIFDGFDDGAGGGGGEHSSVF